MRLLPPPAARDLDWSTRQRLSTLIQRGAPIPEQDRSAARLVAQDILRFRWNTWLYAFLALDFGLIVVLGDNVLLWMNAGIAVLYLVFSVVSLTGHRRARRVLREYSDNESEECEQE